MKETAAAPRNVEKASQIPDGLIVCGGLTVL